MAHTRIDKWGNNLAIRLPSEIVRAAELHDGENLEIEAEAGRIVIRRLEPAAPLEDLFRSKTAEEWRALYAGAYDWGPDVGRELVDE